MNRVAILLGLVWMACGDGPSTPDAALRDAPPLDTNNGLDADGLDARIDVSNVRDAGPDDAATLDAPIPDALVPDAGAPDLRAFPGAVGAGADATGGRGGAVCHVVSRENTLRGEESAPGLHEGTLRYCLGLDERRTIVFDVSGNFDLGRQSVPLESSFEDEGIYIANGDFTLAGQTAPQGGVTISANQFYIGPGARNIIIRYIRFRGGQSSFNGDGITFAEDHGAVVLDHCSFSFSKDENLDIGRDAQATVSHGLFGPGKTGALVGSSNRIMNAGSYTFVQNLFANITHRFPKVGGPSDVYVGNNFIHNWMFRIVRMDPFDYRLNFVDNYLQKGVNTRLASPPNSNLNKSWVRPFDGFDTPSPRIYADGNALPDSPPAGFPGDQSLLFQEFQHDDSPPLAGGLVCRIADSPSGRGHRSHVGGGGPIDGPPGCRCHPFAQRGWFRTRVSRLAGCITGQPSKRE